MSNYKLVPVELIERAAIALERFANDTLAGRNSAHELRELLAAAPAVQEEPVGWQFWLDGTWWDGGNLTKQQRKNMEEAGVRVRDVYAAPQPAEQKPEQGAPSLVEALRQYRNNDGSSLVFGYDMETTQRVVAGLVEALEELREPISLASMEYDGGYEKYLDLIDAALAAHRKQGGEK